MVCCVRGATTVKENSRAEILENTKVMLYEIIRENNLNIEEIISILFTCTKDLTKVYPAVAAREIGIVDASLMCVQELYVEGSLEKCIRVSVTVEGNLKQKECKHIYLNEATRLRPDIVSKSKIEAVAIDGPAGSGKSTVAKLISSELGYVYVDTGAMYRTVGLYCLKNNVCLDRDEDIIESLDKIDIKLEFSKGFQKILLNGIDVTEDIRKPEVACVASRVASVEAVREKLVFMQKEIAKKSKVVMDGRDIGTNVLKNARTKIYLDADVDERAKRRCNELSEKEISFDYNKIREEIILRDEQDKNRKVNPLSVAKDAVVIDTSGMSIEQVKTKILEIINSK